MPALNCLSLCPLLKQVQGPNLAAQEVGRVVEYMTNVVSAISPTVCLLPIHLRGSIKESIVSSAGGGAQGSGNVLCMVTVTETLRVKEDLCLLPFTASSYHMTICDGAYMHVWLGFFHPQSPCANTLRTSFISTVFPASLPSSSHNHVCHPYHHHQKRGLACPASPHSAPSEFYLGHFSSW